MLIDVTLREGEQAFGVYFDRSTRTEVIQALAGIGVDEIEIGYAGQEDLPGVLEKARDLAPGLPLAVWTPLKISGLLQALEAGPDRISLGVPVSDLHLATRLGMSRARMLERLVELVARARAEGCGYVSVGLEDIARARPDFALKVAETAIRSGASRIRLSDTVGLLDPLATADLVRRFRSALDVTLGFHAHDDFGMATANALTALATGADFADVSVLGLGERAGVARLEEVAAFLAVSRETAYDLSGIRSLCELVARKAGLGLPRDKAVVGRDLFACESGLHVHGLARDPALFEPLSPELLGAKRTWALGKKSGRSAVRMALDRLGIERHSGTLAGLTGRVRGTARQLGRPLTEAEVRDLVRDWDRETGPEKAILVG